MTDYGTIETTRRRPLRAALRATAAAPDREGVGRAHRAGRRSRSGGRAREVELAEGGRARLEWLNGDAVADGRITRLEPPHAIEFDTDIHGRLLWELQPDDDGTRLTLTVTAELPDEYLRERARRLARATSTSSRTRSTARPSTGRTGRRTAGQMHNERYEASMRPIS